MSNRYMNIDRFLDEHATTSGDNYIDKSGLGWFIKRYKIDCFYVNHDILTGPTRVFSVNKIRSRCINDDLEALNLLFMRPVLAKQHKKHAKNETYLSLHCDNDGNTVMSIIDKLVEFKMYLYLNNLVIDVYDDRRVAFMSSNANTLLVIRKKTAADMEDPNNRYLIVKYYPKGEEYPVKWYLGCNMNTDHKETLIGGRKYVITNVDIPNADILNLLSDRLHVGKHQHVVYDA